MYEQFYRAGTDDTAGTHYTPPELVEFVLGRVLTDEVLETSPKDLRSSVRVGGLLGRSLPAPSAPRVVR